jgi:hypothetical protein
MMRMSSLGVRPRRGAWEGSRQAKAVAAACFAVLAFALVPPQQAAAYPCGDGVASVTPPRTLAGVAADECRVPETLRHPTPAAERKRRRGSVSGLTVFILAVAGALLIPIGRNGLPHGGDPFGHDPTHEPKF